MPTDTSSATKTQLDELASLSDALSRATSRGQTALSSWLKAWEGEMARYLEDFSAHRQVAFDALCKCESPVDILTVEQQWAASRAQANLEAALRLAQVFAEAAQGVGGGQTGAVGKAKPSSRTKPATVTPTA